MNITICGGGNLGHVCAGFLAEQEDNHVSLLTSRPDQWSSILEVVDNEGKTYKGHLEKISAKPSEVIPNADIVLVCLPGYAIHDVLKKIVSCLHRETWVGTVVSSTGFFFDAFKLLPGTQPLFGFQRVPFISRVINYGHVAELKGYKKSLSVAVEQTDQKESLRAALENLFRTPVTLFLIVIMKWLFQIAILCSILPDSTQCGKIGSQECRMTGILNSIQTGRLRLLNC